jgi:hypothetical protein
LKIYKYSCENPTPYRSTIIDSNGKVLLNGKYVGWIKPPIIMELIKSYDISHYEGIYGDSLDPQTYESLYLSIGSRSWTIHNEPSAPVRISKFIKAIDKMVDGFLRFG